MPKTIRPARALRGGMCLQNALFEVYPLAKIAKYLKYTYPIVMSYPQPSLLPFSPTHIFVLPIHHRTQQGEKKEHPKSIDILNINLRNAIHNPGRVSSALCKCLDEIFDDVVDVFDSDRDTNEILCDSAGELLCFRKLLMSS